MPRASSGPTQRPASLPLAGSVGLNRLVRERGPVDEPSLPLAGSVGLNEIQSSERKIVSLSRSPRGERGFECHTERHFVRHDLSLPSAVSSPRTIWQGEVFQLRAQDGGTVRCSTGGTRGLLACNQQ